MDNPYHAAHVKAEVNQAKQLVGFTVESICHTVDFSSFGIQFRRGKQRLTAWVDCDPEGNGPGHLNIEEGS